MKKNIVIILSTGILIVSACQNNSKQTAKHTKPPMQVQQIAHKAEPKNAKPDTQTEADLVVEATNLENQQLTQVKLNSQQANLIAKVKAEDPTATIVYAPFDNNALFLDTTFQGVASPLELKVKTISLNDSAVVQELQVMDIRRVGKKEYVVSHNYQTELQLKRAGELIAKHLITKEFFKDYIHAEFLEKAILKHPEQAELNPATNAIQMQFLIGVPATDWIVSATLALKPDGAVQVLKVEHLGL